MAAITVLSFTLGGEIYSENQPALLLFKKLPSSLYHCLRPVSFIYLYIYTSDAACDFPW